MSVRWIKPAIANFPVRYSAYLWLQDHRNILLAWRSMNIEKYYEKSSSVRVGLNKWKMYSVVLREVLFGQIMDEKFWIWYQLSSCILQSFSNNALWIETFHFIGKWIETTACAHAPSVQVKYSSLLVELVATWLNWVLPHLKFIIRINYLVASKLDLPPDAVRTRSTRKAFRTCPLLSFGFGGTTCITFSCSYMTSQSMYMN